MRVLHVISSLDSRAGGPSIAVSGLCKAQKGAGIDVSVLATFRQGEGTELSDDLGAQGISVTRVGPTHGPLFSHADLKRVTREQVGAADVVHVHALWEDIQSHAAKAARLAGKPYVFTPHGMLTPWSLRQSALKKKIYLALRLRRHLDRAAALHFTTTTERDAVSSLDLEPPTIVEPLGVDLSEFETLPARGSFRGKHPQLAGKRIVMFLGRLHPGKGMEYLIPALAAAKLRDTMLVAVGPDSHGFEATLRSLVEQHGVRDDVLFTGMLRGRERIEVLVDADLFALPSEHENFGVAVIEALACGVPVVISDGVALKDEILAAGVGAVVPVQVERIAEALRRWTSDDALRASAAALAPAFVRERFDWSSVARHWVDHYAGLTAARTARR